MAAAIPGAAPLDPAVALKPPGDSTGHLVGLVRGREFSAEHDRCAAQAAHYELGIVRLAAFAMPACDQRVCPVRIG